jgi:pimeloyl-ACP methyl ester carboxylesterase
MSGERAGAAGAPAAAEVRYLARADGGRLAWAGTPGAAPTVAFLGGYASDMTGTKAHYLEEWCRARGQAFLRFDYRGHGLSSGRLVDGTIGGWRDDALAVLGACAEGPLVLVGSSMGAWLMLLTALGLPGRVHALVGVAAAPDFTEDLLWAPLPPAQREALRRDGVLFQPSRYGAAPLPVTWALVEEGRRHLLLRAPIPLDCPVRLLHGTADPEVPWETSWRLAEALRSRDVTLTLVKGGEHRLSEPRELALLGAAVGSVV